MFFFLCLQTAQADLMQDLGVASNKELAEADRMVAFEKLVSQGNTTITPLVELAENDEADARQRWVAVRAMGKIRGPAARDSLLRLIHNDMPAMRAAAIGALGDFGDPGHAPPVADKLSDPAIMVRVAAADALATLQNPTTVSALENALSDPSNHYRGSSLWVRRHYVEAMGAIGDRKSYPALLRCLDDADRAVVGAAIIALEQISGHSFADGRDATEEQEAWRRWVTEDIRRNPPI